MMPTDHGAAVRAALDALVAALVAAVTDAAPVTGAPDRLLSVAEAADALGIGRSALYGELQAGRLPSLKVGRRRLVASAALADYIRRRSGAEAA